MVMEYMSHSCSGYNVGGSFFNYEKNIVTGTYFTKNKILNWTLINLNI